ncbi:hypothetical protein, partial [Pseudoalteromonas sp.]|uniref:hypothetical protein n=1 Tax=Pseudoalteromonas sp. TaxID=53249 RepID=UPI002625D3EC
DNVALNVGTGTDLVIEHNGTNSLVTSNTGDLIFDIEDASGDFEVRLGSDTSTSRFVVYNDSVARIFTIQADGEIEIEDGVPLSFGDNNDFSIYHDGSTTTHFKHINNSDMLFQGTGTTNSEIHRLSTATSTTSFRIQDSASADILVATGDGVINIPDNGVLSIGTGGDLTISHDATDTAITAVNGDITFDIQGATQDFELFLGSDNSLSEFIVLNNSSNVIYRLGGDGISKWGDAGSTITIGSAAINATIGLTTGTAAGAAEIIFYNNADAEVGRLEYDQVKAHLLLDTNTGTDLVLTAGATANMGFDQETPISNFHFLETTSTIGNTAGRTYEQSGTGDVTTHYLLTGGEVFSHGIDNTDDSYKISNAYDLGTDTALTIDTSGNTTLSGTAQIDGGSYNLKKSFSYNPSTTSTIYTQYIGTYNVANGSVDITITDTGNAHGSSSFFRVTRHYGQASVVHFRNDGNKNATYNIHYRTIDGSIYELFFSTSSTYNATISFDAYIDLKGTITDSLSAANDTGISQCSVILSTENANDSVVLGGDLSITDNNSLSIGTGGDLTISHVPGDNLITAVSGDITFDIQGATQDYEIFLGSDNSLSEFIILNNSASRLFTVDGSGAVRVPDNVGLYIGTGADLELLHDGTDSYLTSQTGDFYIDSTNTTGLTAVALATDTNATKFQVLNNSGDALFQVDGAGKVGINNDTPIKDLHVQGTFYSHKDANVPAQNYVLENAWTSRVCSEGSLWRHSVWSAELGIFVTVASQGTNQVMTSPDGVNWTSRTAAASSAWQSVEWSPEQEIFVAVSADGDAMTSPDGITWTSRTIEASYWFDVVWSAELGIFVAVSYDGTNLVSTSPDGVTWTSRTAAAAHSWDAIAWSPEQRILVAVSDDGTVMSSPDGITWTSRTAAAANDWNDVTWSPELGIFVAVADSGASRVMTSPDGITWTSRTAAAANDWNDVEWAPELGLFVAVAESGTDRIMTSPDGITWTSGSASENIPWSNIVWSPELGIFCVVGSSGSNRVMTSAQMEGYLNVLTTTEITTVSTATYTLLITDDILHVTRTATGTCTITLPTAQVTSGRVIVVKDAAGNAGTYNITIDTQGSEDIDGEDTAVINSDYSAINLYSDGSNWFVY